IPADLVGPDDCDIDIDQQLTCGGVSGIDLAPGQGFTVVVYTTIPSNYFTAALPGGNGELGSNFEIDGNTQLDDDGLADPPLLDWGLFLTEGLPEYVQQNDMETGQNDDSFGQGSKNDTEPPSVVDGSIPNNKSDLVTMAASSEQVANDKFIYLAWLRTETLGPVNIDFELNQSTEVSANLVTPMRTEGDVIVSFDFASGENIVQLSLRIWEGTQWSEPIDLDATELAQGAVNDPDSFADATYPSDNPWGVTPPGDPLADLTFGEAVINATKTFGETLGLCQTFNSVYVKSRSSTSFTASLKDFIAPQQVEIDTCQSINLLNTATVNSSNVDSKSDSATIKVTNDHTLVAGAASELPFTTTLAQDPATVTLDQTLIAWTDHQFDAATSGSAPHLGTLFAGLGGPALEPARREDDQDPSLPPGYVPALAWHAAPPSVVRGVVGLV
ncbi:MAG: hypothetical protein JSV66_05310, partial [Trueperaceae bacterium]